jgi:2-methylcitrate dehydratase PrpD
LASERPRTFHPSLTRRELLRGAGGLMAAGVVPWTTSSITAQVARYMVEARRRTLPPSAATAGRHRILDTLAAMVSGASLKPGQMAIKYVRGVGGLPEASIITTEIRTSAVDAALANGMLAHADETDDFDPITKAHPGCAVVPAALAVAEREGRSGADLLQAVALGYDLCCRFLLALDPDALRQAHRSAEGMGATIGSAAAAAALAGLDEQGMRHTLSYAAQQVSGIWSWARDTEHVEKAFDFAGMGARNGVTAALMAQAGFTGVPDVFDGDDNVLVAFSAAPAPAKMVADLGARFFITETAIKPFSVGYPIQAALDAFLTLRREHGLTVQNVDRLVVRLPEDGARVVDNRAMPDVNCQYIMAVALVDGTVSFAASHSYERMADPEIRAVKDRVQLIADRALMDPAAPRSGLVEVTLRDGRVVRHLTRHPPGAMENPLTTEAVNAKAEGLMTPIMGARRTKALIERVNALEDVKDVRDLRPLLTAS